MRSECAHRSVESVDLREDPLWRDYICSHPNAREIIGTGITHFEGGFINRRMPNTVQLGSPQPFGNYRFDFVVRRNDGTACRLHPNAKSDAIPVQGRLRNWVISPPIASTPGLDAAGPPTISERHDVMMSSGLVLYHLCDMRDHWIDRGEPLDELAEDLLEQSGGLMPAPWIHFLMSMPWGGRSS